MSQPTIAIGALVKRSGIAASALRFYESQGLIEATRSSGGRRLFARDVLRRVAFIRFAHSVGLSLEEIRAALKALPVERKPTKADWAQLSSSCRPILDRRIEALTRLRDRLTSCIGCGCLSLDTCALYNPEDAAQVRGNGPRYLLGDEPPPVTTK